VVRGCCDDDDNDVAQSCGAGGHGIDGCLGLWLSLWRSHVFVSKP